MCRCLLLRKIQMAWAPVKQCIFQTERSEWSTIDLCWVMMLSQAAAVLDTAIYQSFTQWARNSEGRGSGEPCNPEQDLGSIRHLISK